MTNTTNIIKDATAEQLTVKWCFGQTNINADDKQVKRSYSRMVIATLSKWDYVSSPPQLWVKFFSRK